MRQPAIGGGSPRRWLGNTPAVGQGHYQQVHDAHFERAVGENPAGVTPTKATQRATPHAAEWPRTEPQSPGREVA